MPSSTPTQLLSSAPPPWHSLATWTVLTSLMIYLLPTWESLDQIATVETFTHRLFPDWITIQQLAAVRLTFAAIVAVSVADFYFGPGVDLHTSYLAGSKLRTCILKLKGWRTLGTFTNVAWILLGVHFSLSGYISLIHSRDSDTKIPAWMLRAAIVTWTISAPYTVLVSGIIRYIIWDQVLRDGGTTEDLTCLRNTLMHNLNVFMAMSELCLLGGLTMRWQDIPFGTLFGTIYTAFTWSTSTAWGVDVKEHGPQFLYFFVDTTLPGFTPTLYMLALWATLLIFMVLFIVSGTTLSLLGGDLVTHVSFVLCVCSIVMRFRD